eukprot:9106477-Lingulodinium_polyedra.AAC.1
MGRDAQAHRVHDVHAQGEAGHAREPEERAVRDMLSMPLFGTQDRGTPRRVGREVRPRRSGSVAVAKPAGFVAVEVAVQVQVVAEPIEVPHKQPHHRPLRRLERLACQSPCC